MSVEPLAPAGSVTQRPIRVGLRWSPGRPDEVSLLFSTGQEQVRWEMALQLLRDGVDGPAGMGDVFWCPSPLDPTLVELVLASPNGRAGFLVNLQDLCQFLALVDAAPAVAAPAELSDSQIWAALS
jgi:hypothetical protein